MRIVKNQKSTMFEKYRLYVDEVGNHDITHADEENNRYLSLTGVVFNLTYVAEVLNPRMESMKRKFFKSHPDDPIILHRKEIVNKKYPFHSLRDKEIERQFNETILSFFDQWEYTVITVVIDKKEHHDLYTIWHYDPYHYCMAVMLERFVFILEDLNAVGDVMAESRGGREDRRLKRSYSYLIKHGTDFVESSRFESRFSSCQLKVKNKQNNISGLQVADLIAHPSRRAILKESGKIQDDRLIFGDKIEEILKRKYYRSKTGEILGYGKKLLS